MSLSARELVWEANGRRIINGVDLTIRPGHAVTSALEQVGMADRKSQGWQTLSGGERQRIHIARALAQQPTEILLDEPTNHLDIHHQIELIRLIGSLARTTIMALHDLNHAAAFCDDIVVLAHGRIVAAGAPVIVLTEDLLRDVFKVEARLETSPTMANLISTS